MQNEFEKQVQQKMNELDFVPSPPVWQNIEKQIRKDKNRRRIIFWIPITLLLLGAGVYFNLPGEKQNSSRASVGKSNSNLPEPLPDNIKNTSKENALENNSVTSATSAQKTSDFQATQLITTNKEQQKGVTKMLEQEHPYVSIAETSANNSFVVKEGKVILKKQPGTNVQQPELVKENDGGRSQNQIGIAGNKNDTISKVRMLDSASKKDSILKAIVQTENVYEKIGLPGAKSKWELGILAGVGYSGEGKGISLSENKSFDMFSQGSASQVPTVSTTQGSPINKNFSAVVGLMAKKEISNRVSFLTGLNLHYYSSSRSVGKQMQDSTIASIGNIPRLYLNTGAVVNKVNSAYYFISLPLMLDWKFINNKPFHLQAGVSIQQLIASNAIQFNSQYSIYYKDPSSLKKTQLFSSLMLAYEFKLKNKAALLLGPSLQYGFSRLNENENKHLFYTGVNLQYFFK